jgi:hypothetical protein
MIRSGCPAERSTNIPKVIRHPVSTQKLFYRDAMMIRSSSRASKGEHAASASRRIMSQLIIWFPATILIDCHTYLRYGNTHNSTDHVASYNIVLLAASRTVASPPDIPCDTRTRRQARTPSPNQHNPQPNLSEFCSVTVPATPSPIFDSCSVPSTSRLLHLEYAA